MLSGVKHIIANTLLVTLIVISGCQSRNKPIVTGLEGKQLPAFNILLPNGSSIINTLSDVGHQSIVLFYFSPQCPYCRNQMREIVDRISSLKSIKFYVFTSWPLKETQSFYKEYELYKYPNLVVGVDYNNFFKEHFKAQGVPYMAIYGKDKKLKQAFIGNVNTKQIKEVAES
jgi:hypothetical protein